MFKMKICNVKNAINLSKIFFSAFNFFVHIFNISLNREKTELTTNNGTFNLLFIKIDAFWWYFQYLFQDQYICNIPAKYSNVTLKAVGGVDFTKYALSTKVLYT